MNTIRKISVGLNYPDGAIHYQVGKPQKLNNELYEITSIKIAYEQDGGIVYQVIIQGKEGSNVIWKEITNMPVVVEYLIDFE